MIEFKILTKDLVKSLSLALSVVEKKNVIPILSNVKLKNEGNILTITATDGDLLLRQKVGIHSISAGALTVNLFTFTSIARKIPDKETYIRYVNNNALVEGASCKFNLAVIEANQFPEMQEVETDLTCTISARALKKILRYTEFSTSTEEMRYNLNGIFFHTSSSKLLVATTDGHRLSTTATDLVKDDKFEFILPRKTVAELSKVLNEIQDIDVIIKISKNKVQFNIRDVVIISKLIDATFPQYQRLIPNAHPYSLKVDVRTFLSAIDRVSTISTDKFRSVRLEITETKIEISSAYDSYASGKEWIEFGKACEYKGNSLTIGFNPRYMMDILEALNSGDIIISLADSVSAILVQHAGDKNSSFVVMPVKVA